MRKFRIPVVLQDREHGFENWSQKRIRTRFAQGSHSCYFRTEILGGTESMLFENLSQKRIRTRGCVVRKFRTRGMGGANFAVSWLFSPVFPCFSFFKLSYLHVNTKTNSNHIRMNSRAKIKIKTCIYTRKEKDKLD